MADPQWERNSIERERNRLYRERTLTERRKAQALEKLEPILAQRNIIENVKVDALERIAATLERQWGKGS